VLGGGRGRSNSAGWIETSRVLGALICMFPPPTLLGKAVGFFRGKVEGAGVKVLKPVLVTSGCMVALGERGLLVSSLSD